MSRLLNEQSCITMLLCASVAVSAFPSLPGTNMFIYSRRRPSNPNYTPATQHLYATTIPPPSSVENVETIYSPHTERPAVIDETALAEQSQLSRKTYLDDGFIFGLANSGLERPKGKQALLVVQDDSLETKPYQVAIVAGTLTVQTLLILNCISDIFAKYNGDVLTTAVVVASILLTSWVLADLGSGIFHWSVDNYGNGKTPILGSIIAAFQGHHTAPWTITERGFCNNIYKLCTPFGIPTVLAVSAITGPMATLFFSSFCTLEVLSQEFHKWSHMTKKEVPPWVNTMQDIGVTVNRKQHALHHFAPYEGNYCIVSGFCNEVLDNIGFFRRLEKLIYEINGIESNAWKLDPELRARTLRGEFTI